MTGALARVEQVGIATVQDEGRPGRSDIGVPRSGAWHRARYRAASALMVAADAGQVPAVEVLAGDLRLRILDVTSFAVIGPARVALNGAEMPTATVLAAGAGDLVELTPLGRGPVYLVLAGWRPPRVLGSCSFDSFARLGPGPLAVGDVLEGVLGSTDRVGWFAREVPDPVGRIRVVPTSAAGLDDGMVDDFLEHEWQVTSVARSGVRLRSAGWTGPRASVASQPVVPGTVQLTPDGEAIVLGPDGAITGGYPVVGVVASVDGDRPADLAAGTVVRFAPVTVEAAVAAHAQARSAVVTHPGALA